MPAEQKLKEMGLELGPVGTPVANFIPAVRTGNLLFVAGHIAGRPDGSVLNPGKVGREVTEEQAYESAKLAMLNCLASIKQELGDLDKVKRVVKLGAFVNCVEDFKEHPNVVNGTSDLMAEVFGDAGRCTRTNVGVLSLPLGFAVEIDGVFEIE